MGELARASPRARRTVQRPQNDGYVMSRHPTHAIEASSSRAALPAPDAVVVRPEQERGHTSAPPAHFDEAQAEQVLWQEFRDHNASLNNALNEALRIHRGPAWRIFRVCISIEFGVFSLVSSAFVLLLTQFLSCLVHR
jgi:hypothetical protein